MTQEGVLSALLNVDSAEQIIGVKARGRTSNCQLWVLIGGFKIFETEVKKDKANPIWEEIETVSLKVPFSEGNTTLRFQLNHISYDGEATCIGVCDILLNGENLTEEMSTFKLGPRPEVPEDSSLDTGRGFGSLKLSYELTLGEISLSEQTKSEGIPEPSTADQVPLSHLQNGAGEGLVSSQQHQQSPYPPHDVPQQGTLPHGVDVPQSDWNQSPYPHQGDGSQFPYPPQAPQQHYPNQQSFPRPQQSNQSPYPPHDILQQGGLPQGVGVPQQYHPSQGQSSYPQQGVSQYNGNDSQLPYPSHGEIHQSQSPYPQNGESQYGNNLPYQTSYPQHPHQYQQHGEYPLPPSSYPANPHSQQFQQQLPHGEYPPPPSSYPANPHGEYPSYPESSYPENPHYFQHPSHEEELPYGEDQLPYREEYLPSGHQQTTYGTQAAVYPPQVGSDVVSDQHEWGGHQTDSNQLSGYPAPAHQEGDGSQLSGYPPPPHQEGDGSQLSGYPPPAHQEGDGSQLSGYPAPAHQEGDGSQLSGYPPPAHQEGDGSQLSGYPPPPHQEGDGSQLSGYPPPPPSQNVNQESVSPSPSTDLHYEQSNNRISEEPVLSSPLLPSAEPTPQTETPISEEVFVGEMVTIVIQSVRLLKIPTTVTAPLLLHLNQIKGDERIPQSSVDSWDIPVSIQSRLPFKEEITIIQNDSCVALMGIVVNEELKEPSVYELTDEGVSLQVTLQTFPVDINLSPIDNQTLSFLQQHDTYEMPTPITTQLEPTVKESVIEIVTTDVTTCIASLVLVSVGYLSVIFPDKVNICLDLVEISEVRIPTGVDESINKWLIAPYEYHCPGQAPVNYPPETPYVVRYLVRPPTGMDYTSPLYTNLLGGDTNQRFNEALVAPKKKKETEIQTDIELNEMTEIYDWWLEKELDRESNFESFSSEDDDDTPQPSRRASVASYKSGVSSRSHGVASASVPIRCSDPECRKINFTVITSRKKNTVNQVKYCGNCGCHLSLEEPDGVLSELRSLKTQLTRKNELLLAKTTEMIKIEEQLGYHKNPIAFSGKKKEEVNQRDLHRRAIRTGVNGKPIGNNRIEAIRGRKRSERITKKRIENELREHANQMSYLKSKLYKDGGAELRRAAEHGITSVFQKLRKVDPELSGISDCADHNGRTPLSIASQHGHVSIISICLQYEEPINRVRSTDVLSKIGHPATRSPDNAIQHCFPAVEGGYSLLHCAAFSGKIAVLEYLLERFATDSKLEELLFLKTKQGNHTAKELAALYKFAYAQRYLRDWEDRYREVDWKRAQQRALRLNGNFVPSPRNPYSPSSST